LWPTAMAFTGGQTSPAVRGPGGTCERSDQHPRSIGQIAVRLSIEYSERMSVLNYTHLRAFRAVAAEGNLTRAAEKLGVAQSAVSTQIKELEARLGHTLFERRGRSMVLTEAGRIAFDCAERAFAAGDELVETLAGRSEAAQVVRGGDGDPGPPDGFVDTAGGGSLATPTGPTPSGGSGG